MENETWDRIYHLTSLHWDLNVFELEMPKSLDFCQEWYELLSLVVGIPIFSNFCDSRCEGEKRNQMARNESDTTQTSIHY